MIGGVNQTPYAEFEIGPWAPRAPRCFSPHGALEILLPGLASSGRNGQRGRASDRIPVFSGPPLTLSTSQPILSLHLHQWCTGTGVYTRTHIFDMLSRSRGDCTR